MAEYLLIGIIAFIVSVISGVLGLGGAIMLIPAYLYLPSLFGIDSPDIKNISGMTSLQVFAVSLLGMLLHKKRNAFNNKLVLFIGIPIVVSSFIGALLSGWVHPDFIIGIFAFMALAAVALMVIDHGNRNINSEEGEDFSKFIAVSIGIVVGFLGGMAGAPGAFLLSPLLLTIMKIPVRVTIGSTLGIVLLAAFATSIGKIGSGIVPYDLTFIAILFSIPGVILGSNLSHRFKPASLRWGLVIIITLMGIDMWYKILF